MRKDICKELLLFATSCGKKMAIDTHTHTHTHKSHNFWHESQPWVAINLGTNLNSSPEQS